MQADTSSVQCLHVQEGWLQHLADLLHTWLHVVEWHPEAEWHLEVVHLHHTQLQEVAHPHHAWHPEQAIHLLQEVVTHLHQVWLQEVATHLLQA